MIKTEIVVPKGIRYLSDWEDFSLPEYPSILDKQLPGCGFTEWCIRNNMNIILVSPRKILLENKHEQHPNETYLVVNSYDKDAGVDKDLLTVSKNSSLIDEDKYLESLARNNAFDIKHGISNYVQHCVFCNIPSKILVTYDSFKYVKDCLIQEKLFDKFFVIVDEFQSIFTDSTFKSDAELEFVSKLQDVRRVCYVSATPMIDKYLDMLEEFKYLPYFYFNWEKEDPFRIIKPDLKVRTYGSINTLAEKIINTYLNGEFEKAIKEDENGNLIEVESKEVVFYVNSVKNIIGIIKKCRLQPDQVNIICAKNEYNLSKIQKSLGKKFTIGKVPLEFEPRKMFTFCTRTAYLGADFYSDNARTIIVSDANMKTLKVDISLDLPQILGRQRLDSNPWKNRAEFYYKTVSDYKKMSVDDFNKEIEDKKLASERLLSVYLKGTGDEKYTLARKYQKDASNSNYKDDYVSVNRRLGNDLIPVFNNLVMVAEMRAFEIQQIDYKDRFTVFNRVGEYLGKNMNRLDFFFEEFYDTPKVQDKLKLIVESNLDQESLDYIFKQIDPFFERYYKVLGPEKLRGWRYDLTDIAREYNKLIFDKDILRDYVYQEFKEGDKISLANLKNRLSLIYSDINYFATPKASDLEQYFELKACKFVETQENGEKKSVNGYKLIKKKY